MQKFTETYEKARDVVRTQKFSADWDAYLKNKLSIQKFLGQTGFDGSRSKAPESLRQKIGESVRSEKIDAGEVLYAAATNATSSGTVNERAATLKLLQHVHLTKESGGQKVWVYAPPQSDSGWVFDEITGSANTVKERLKREDEIFSDEQRRWMSSALGLARKISEDCKIKLAGGVFRNVKEATREKVRKWFLDETSSDETLAEALKILLAGFKKIAIACNANTLVFTDYPDWRAQRDNYFGAAFRGGEGGGFPVVYIEGAFTRLTGNSGKQWLCVETIIHELSHHEVSTDDHRYDSHGLKPDGASFPYAKAISNADSWGYFALDLAGYLSVSDATQVYK